jgi:ferredoxin
LPKPGREFAEVEQAFDEKHAVDEARRCLRCGPCGECRVCVPSCNRRHIMVRIHDGNGDRPATALVRAPSTVAMGLATASAKSGWLLPSIEARNLSEIDTSACDDAEALAVRAQIVDERCRACGLCVEVCPFHAVSLVEVEGDHSRAYIEPALCRGCNLCTAVCPTRAALPSALSPEWWGDRVEDVFRPTAAEAPPTQPYVVLACQRRAGALERALDLHGFHVEVIRFRCVGQIDAGMLLELHRQGARGVLVAGCETQRCRFGEGARLAEEQVERARSLLRILGRNDTCFVADWSKDRAGDPLDIPLERFLAGGSLQAAPSARS